jgi:hypothetical protein
MLPVPSKLILTITSDSLVLRLTVATLMSLQ